MVLWCNIGCDRCFKRMTKITAPPLIEQPEAVIYTNKIINSIQTITIYLFYQILCGVEVYRGDFCLPKRLILL